MQFTHAIYTLYNYTIGYLQILIGYCLNSYVITTLFSYIFYVTSTILIWYSIIHLLFDTPCLKNNWVF